MKVENCFDTDETRVSIGRLVDAFNAIHLFVSFTSSLSHSLKSVIEVMHNFQLSAFMVSTV